MEAIETYQRNGYTVSIHYDEDGSNANPRDCDGNFLFLGFPHRSYKIGDETLDPSEFSNLAELMAWVKDEYKAHLVLPVGILDHSGVSFYIGGGPHWSDSQGWDSGTCGLILDTPASLAERGFPEPLTEEWLREGMAAEIDEYSKWANGEVYGYVIKDRNGDQVDSCWGYLGFDYVKEQADMEADALSAQPEQLYDVRLNRAEIDHLVGLLLSDPETHVGRAVLDKLQAIDTSEEEE